MSNNICARYIAFATLVTLTSPLLAAGERLDTLIFSDHVLTMTHRRDHASEPMAIGIVGDKIVWLGSHRDGRGKAEFANEVVELGTQAVLPGFIDAHGHVVFVGLMASLANVAAPPVGPVNNIAGLQATLREHIEARSIPPGEWVIGRGYDDSLLAEQRHPDRDDLDAVSTDHPIALMHVSGHLATANSRALARTGITTESPNPPGGIIRRRSGTSQPNGVLEETATYPLREVMASVNEEPLAAVGQAMAVYAKNGITTAQDGASNPESVGLLRAADQQGLVTLDVVAYPMGQAGLASLPSDYAYGEYQGRVKVGGVKLMLDGSPQGKTAYLSKPYHVPPHGQDADYRGYPNIPQARVDELVAEFMQADVPIIAHANGDAAAEMLIDAVDQSTSSAPNTDHRTVMIHAQTVREDQLTRMKTLGMIPSFFAAHTFYWGDWHRDSVLGPQRGKRISPTSSTLSRQMAFTVHNDAPVVPPDMMRLLWATTNRLTRTGKVLGGEQKISTYQALRAVTILAAYQHFEESRKGTLEVGKLADLVVLSQDPLEVSTQDLLGVEVRQTYSHGKRVFPAP